MEININGISINYVNKGNGVPLLLIHGHAESLYIWRHNIDELSKHFNVFALDLKGFGRSDKPENTDYSIQAMSNLIINFMNALKIGPAVLVCHSFGGKIGIQCILDHPLKFKGLVLLGSAVGKFKIWRLFKTMTVKGMGEMMIRMINRRTVKSILKNLHYKDYQVSEEEITEFLEPNKTPGGRKAFLSYLREFLKAEDYYMQHIKKISLPVLIIWGKNDEFISSDHGVLIHEKLENSKLEILEDCGHNSQEDQSIIVNNLIIENFE